MNERRLVHQGLTPRPTPAANSSQGTASVTYVSVSGAPPLWAWPPMLCLPRADCRSAGGESRHTQAGPVPALSFHRRKKGVARREGPAAASATA